MGQRVREGGEVTPHVAVPHAFDHLLWQADHLGLIESSGSVPVARPNEIHQALGGIGRRARPRPFRNERRLVRRYLHYGQRPARYLGAFQVSVLALP